MPVDALERPPDHRIHPQAWIPPTALPSALRKYGFFPDTSVWHPGDVVLTRSKNPDQVSRQIESIQSLGYGLEFAKWTHAAVYLGDGLLLCEAQIDPPHACSVILANIWDYVGSHQLLVRRSNFAPATEQGWAIATSVATRLGDKYDVPFVLRLAADRAFVGEAVWLKDQTHLVSRDRYVCSTLYSTAHAYVTRVSIADRVNGLCVPAHLAGTADLTDVDYLWHRIR